MILIHALAAGAPAKCRSTPENMLAVLDQDSVVKSGPPLTSYPWPERRNRRDPSGTGRPQLSDCSQQYRAWKEHRVNLSMISYYRCTIYPCTFCSAVTRSFSSKTRRKWPSQMCDRAERWYSVYMVPGEISKIISKLIRVPFTRNTFGCNQRHTLPCRT